MRTSRLLMPAATLAGALALAGCGGGSGNAPGTPTDRWTIRAGEALVIGNVTFTCKGEADCVITDLGNLPSTVTRTEKSTITDAQCGEGRKANDAKTMCVDDPAHMSAKANAAKVDRIFDAVRSRAKNSDGVSRGGVTFGTAAFSTDGEVTADFDPDANDPFTTPAAPVTGVKVEETGMAAAIRGWKGKKYAGTTDRAKGNDKYTAVIYHNQDDPKLTAFSAWAAGKNDVTLVAASDGVPAHVVQSQFGSYKITGFGDPSLRAKTYTAGNEVPGTFVGADGSFRCVATSCTSNGRPIGDWIFIPAANAMVATPDADYIRFGWWLQEDNPPSDWANLATFVQRSGSGAARAEVKQAWLGKATYEGAAAGLVAIDRGSGQTGNMAGEFTANATLTADFGKAADTGTVSGTIDGFMVDGQSQGWVVKLLESGNLDAANAFGKSDDGTTWAWTKDDDPAGADGGWQGHFYNEGLDDPEPESVAGTFRAEYENVGAMQGAFGASEKASE